MYKNNQNLNFYIAEKQKPVVGRSKYKVIFEESGYDTYAAICDIKAGKVKDKLAKTILGIACIGTKYGKKSHPIEYAIWSAMIHRCYNVDNSHYSSYGAKGVTVCSRWLNFSNFVEDIYRIDGYDMNLFMHRKIFLDKDIKATKEIPKVYSLETCKFVSMLENCRNQIHNRDKQKKKYLIKGPGDPDFYEITGLNTFCREKGINSGPMFAILRGVGKTFKGYTIKKPL